MSSVSVQSSLAVVDQQPINIATMGQLVSRAMQFCARRQGFTLFTLNLDHVVKRRRDPRFRAAYDRATLVSADGWPIAALARRQGAPIERVTGADLVDPLCAAAAREGVPIFFFGSTEESLALASESLCKKFPGLEIRGAVAPPMGFDPTSAAAIAFGEQIAASGAQLCFVALGAPKQELFADAMAQHVPGVGFLCIGAALDFISGRQRRAPGFVQTIRAEWLWRLASDPRRMAFRYGYCALVFTDVIFRLSTARA